MVTEPVTDCGGLGFCDTESLSALCTGLRFRQETACAASRPCVANSSSQRSLRQRYIGEFDVAPTLYPIGDGPLSASCASSVVCREAILPTFVLGSFAAGESSGPDWRVRGDGI